MTIKLFNHLDDGGKRWLTSGVTKRIIGAFHAHGMHRLFKVIEELQLPQHDG